MRTAYSTGKIPASSPLPTPAPVRCSGNAHATINSVGVADLCHLRDGSTPGLATAISTVYKLILIRPLNTAEQMGMMVRAAYGRRLTYAALIAG